MNNILITKPGDLVHMDHFISRIPDRVIKLTGTPTNHTCTCGHLSKDQLYDKIFVKFQESLDEKERITSKLNIEQKCLLHNALTNSYTLTTSYSIQMNGPNEKSIFLILQCGCTPSKPCCWTQQHNCCQTCKFNALRSPPDVTQRNWIWLVTFWYTNDHWHI